MRYLLGLTRAGWLLPHAQWVVLLGLLMILWLLSRHDPWDSWRN